jgi:hypothetical protein
MQLDSGYRDDDGAADPRLRTALARYLADPGTAGQLLAALGSARLLVPVVATAEVIEHGVEKDSHLSSVEFVAGDGRRALLAFTGTDSLAAWDPAARPVPRQAHQVAQAVLAGGLDALLVDVAGPGPTAVQGTLLARLAVVPAAAEGLTDVLARLQAQAARLPSVHSAEVLQSAAVIRLVLAVTSRDPGLPDAVALLVGDPELALLLDRPLQVEVLADGDLAG